MNAGNNRAREIFLEAIEMEAPDQRATFLQAACGGDLAVANPGRAAASILRSARHLS